MDRTEIVAKIAAELDRAYEKHGREQWGRHEFFGIIKEEFDEMWSNIKTDAPDSELHPEIIQVAAMCFRYLETGDRYRSPSKVFYVHRNAANAIFCKDGDLFVEQGGLREPWGHAWTPVRAGDLAAARKIAEAVLPPV